MERKNREQRRHPEQLDEQQAPPEHERPQAVPADDAASAARRHDDLSVRAKSSGHGKKTADKWNQ